MVLDLKNSALLAVSSTSETLTECLSGIRERTGRGETPTPIESVASLRTT